jgi:hypothetical protein
MRSRTERTSNHNLKRRIHNGTPSGPFMGWSVIEAEDGSAAVRLLADHPFISRGGMLQLSEPI